MTTKKKRRKKKKKKRKIMMIRVLLECASYFLKFLPYLDQKVWFSLHYFFWADLFSTYAFTRSHGLCLLLRKPHHSPPPSNTLDCSLSILGCQNMLKSRRKSMKEEPEVINTWVEVFPTSSHPLGWLFFGVWKDVKSKSHPFRGPVRSL